MCAMDASNSVWERVALPDGGGVSYQQLAAAAFQGVPPPLRPLTWKVLLGFLPAGRPREEVRARAHKQYNNFLAEVITKPTGEAAECDGGASEHAGGTAPGAVPPAASVRAAGTTPGPLVCDAQHGRVSSSAADACSVARLVYHLPLSPPAELADRSSLCRFEHLMRPTDASTCASGCTGVAREVSPPASTAAAAAAAATATAPAAATPYIRRADSPGLERDLFSQGDLSLFGSSQPALLHGSRLFSSSDAGGCGSGDNSGDDSASCDRHVDVSSGVARCNRDDGAPSAAASSAPPQQGAGAAAEQPPSLLQHPRAPTSSLRTVSSSSSASAAAESVAAATLAWQEVADDPLLASSSKSSKWAQWHKDEELRAEIHKDMLRTNAGLEWFNVPDHMARMARILFVYARLNSGVRYVQGMNELLAPLWYVMAKEVDASTGRGVNMDDAEADTFFCFMGLMSEVRDVFITEHDNSPTGVRGMLSRFATIFSRRDPELAGHLQSMGIDHQFYAFRWLTTLLSREFDLDFAIKLWDSLFADQERFNFLLYYCVAMMQLQRTELLTSDFSGVMRVLQQYPPTDFRTLWRAAVAVQDAEALDLSNAALAPFNSGVIVGARGDAHAIATAHVHLTPALPAAPRAPSTAHAARASMPVIRFGHVGGAAGSGANMGSSSSGHATALPPARSRVVSVGTALTSPHGASHAPTAHAAHGALSMSMHIPMKNMSSVTPAAPPAAAKSPRAGDAGSDRKSPVKGTLHQLTFGAFHVKESVRADAQRSSARTSASAAAPPARVHDAPSSADALSMDSAVPLSASPTSRSRAHVPMPSAAATAYDDIPLNDDA